MKLLNNRKISIYGIVFNCIRKESFFELESTYRHYITINSEILIKIIKLDKLRKIYEKSFTTIDSALLFRYLKYRYPKKQIEKLSGSDLLFDIIKNSKENNRKIFFLGGTKKSNNKCVQLINSKYGGNAIGFCPEIIDNKLSKVDEDNFIDLLQSENPYYLLVGLGCPKQEYFINHYENLIIKNINTRNTSEISGSHLGMDTGDIERYTEKINSFSFRVSKLLIANNIATIQVDVTKSAEEISSNIIKFIKTNEKK